MKKEVMQGVGRLAEKTLKGVAGKTPDGDRSSGDRAEGIANSIMDTITGALGAKSGSGQGGGGRGGRGRGGKGGGCGGGKGGGCGR